MANLWKPYSENTGMAAYLSDKNYGSQIYIMDANTGQILDTGRFDKTYEDGRAIYRFNKPGNSFTDIIVVSDTGEYVYIGDGSKRVTGATTKTATLNSKGFKDKYPESTIIDPASIDKSVTGTIEDSGMSNVNGIAGSGNVAAPELINSDNYAYKEFDIEFTDPIETLREIAAQNKGQLDENFLTSLENAGVLSEENTNQLIDYLNAMSPVEQELIGIENAFNQQEKLKAAETALPGITDLLRGEVKNAQTLASGKMLTSVEDNALNQTIRSQGADAAYTKGLGTGSLASQTLSNQLSVSQRLSLMKQGEDYLNTTTQLASALLVDTPNKSKLSQGIESKPSETIGQLTTAQQNIINPYTTMTASDAQSSLTSQRVAEAQLDSSNWENYQNRALNIEQSNLQATNTYNQQVINDTNQTKYAKGVSEAYDWLNTMMQNKWISTDEYNLIVASIEKTGSFNPVAYKEDFWEKYNETKYGGKDHFSQTREGYTPPPEETNGNGSNQSGGNGSNENNENNENNETNENNESNSNNNTETKTVYKSSNGNIKKSVTITPIVSSYTNNLNMVNEILNDPNSSYWDMIKEVL